MENTLTRKSFRALRDMRRSPRAMFTFSDTAQVIKEELVVYSGGTDPTNGRTVRSYRYRLTQKGLAILEEADRKSAERRKESGLSEYNLIGEQGNVTTLIELLGLKVVEQFPIVDGEADVNVQVTDCDVDGLHHQAEELEVECEPVWTFSWKP